MIYGCLFKVIDRKPKNKGNNGWSIVKYKG